MLAVAIGLVLRTLLWPRALFSEPLGHTAFTAALAALAAALCLSPLLFFAVNLPFGWSIVAVLASAGVFVLFTFVGGAVLFGVARLLDTEPAFADTAGLVAQLLLPLSLPACLYLLFASWSTVLAAAFASLAAGWCLYVAWFALVDGLGAAEGRTVGLYGLLFAAAFVAGGWRLAQHMKAVHLSAELAKQIEELKRDANEKREALLAAQREAKALEPVDRRTLRWVVEVQSVPPGAIIWGPHGILGHAPMKVGFMGVDPVTLTLKNGKNEKSVVVTPDVGSVVVTVNDSTPSPPAPPPPSPAANKGKKPTKRKPK